MRTLWQTRLAAAKKGRRPLRLVVRVDPATARPLLNIPWEYLHDGRGFLALDRRTPPLPPPLGPGPRLSAAAGRAAAGAGRHRRPARPGREPGPPPRKEEDLLLRALAGARRTGKATVEFTPNGSLETLENWLDEFDPHVLHFAGHGVFVTAQDRGFLLMETAAGERREVDNGEFCRAIEQRAKSLRMAFFSACQTAVSPRTDGFTDLGPRLIESPASRRSRRCSLAC